MTYWQTCDNCNGKKTLHAPCPDEAKYRARGESCLVLHYQTCPACHGEGKTQVEGILIPGTFDEALKRTDAALYEYFKWTDPLLETANRVLNAIVGLPDDEGEW